MAVYLYLYLYICICTHYLDVFIRYLLDCTKSSWIIKRHLWAQHCHVTTEEPGEFHYIVYFCWETKDVLRSKIPILANLFMINCKLAVQLYIRESQGFSYLYLYSTYIKSDLLKQLSVLFK